MIEKVEIKINKLKKKINPKILGVLAFMVLGGIAIYSMEMSNNFKRQKNLIQDQYNKSMYEVVGYVNDAEVDLAKLQLTNDKRMEIVTLANIWKQSNLAKTNLNSLPVNQGDMLKASKYLAQLSDFSYSLMSKLSAGGYIEVQDEENIKTMYSEARELSNIVGKIYDDLNRGRIKWDEVEKLASKNLNSGEEKENYGSIQSLGKNFQEYEGLIYDGAFSDHILSISPKLIENLDECTKDEATAYIEEIFGKDKIKRINEEGLSEGKIDLYNFSVEFNDSNEHRQISITKKGKKLYLMLGERGVNDENIRLDEAKKKAYEFLSSLGINDVEDTYYLKSENTAIINFASKQDDITLYPDLVKVKVALDNGEVLSVEAQGYIYNHIERKNIIPKISIKEAKKNINKDIEILSEGLAIIPTESKSEVLTYEFKGKIDEREFLIYINANTGIEEKILLIINTDDSILTI